jgi:hypothetical protein
VAPLLFLALIHRSACNTKSRKFVTLGIVDDETGEEIHTPFPCTCCGEGEWTPRPGRTYESRLREEAH